MKQKGRQGILLFFLFTSNKSHDIQVFTSQFSHNKIKQNIVSDETLVRYIMSSVPPLLISGISASQPHYRSQRPKLPSWSRPRPNTAPRITSSLEHQLDEIQASFCRLPRLATHLKSFLKTKGDGTLNKYASFVIKSNSRVITFWAFVEQCSHNGHTVGVNFIPLQ